MIDPHVHCRDGNEAYKETIKHVFEVAKAQGVKIIFDMPNTKPPILTEADVLERLELVPKTEVGNYFLFLGLTSDEQQLQEAVNVYRKFKEVIGFKLYAGESVGDLAVIDPKKQFGIYRILADLNYKGVLAVHCEKESELKSEEWDPLNPISHSFARPQQAEISAIQDQIRFAKEMDFQGTLHIVHISCPKSVELVDEARKDIKITCGVTPHHILWDAREMNRPDGLLYKMNPPLRSQVTVSGLIKLLIAGKIDWIETDHAPHAIGEKLFFPYLSGFPSLYLYRKFVEEFLPSIGVSPKQIRKLTFENICRTFGLEMQERRT